MRSRRVGGPSAMVRRLVFARALGCCEGCGASVIGRAYTIAPRVAPGAAALSRAEANAAWNLTLLCGSAASPGGCQLRREELDEDLRERGIWLRSGENPRLVPVRLASPAGGRVQVWLNGEGTYDLEPPARDRVSRRPDRRLVRLPGGAHLGGHWMLA